MITNDQIHLNKILIEQLVRSMVLRGETKNEKIVAEVDALFHPESEFEMEEYSEAILYGKFSVLN